MGTNYPGSEDDNTTLPNPAGDQDTDAGPVTHSELHSNANAAIKALETAVGTTGDWAFVVADATVGGDLSGTLPDPTLAEIVSAQGPTGGSSTIPVITIDAKGRVTALTTAAIGGGPPTGTAGGDLSGSYPNPTVAQLQGVAISSATATLLSQMTAPVGRTATGTAAAGEETVLTGTTAGQTLSLHATPTSGTVNSVINLSTQNWTIHPASGTLNLFGTVGDITLAPNQGLQAVYLASGTVWYVMDFTFSTVGGDLSGTIPNPTVVKIQGVSISSGQAGLLAALGTVQARTASATVAAGENTAFTGSTASQTLTLPASTTQQGTINTIVNDSTTTVSVAAGAGTTVNILGSTGTFTLAPDSSLQFILNGTVWYAFGYSYQTAGGDLTGTFPNPTLNATNNVINLIQQNAWQDTQRRGGNIGIATTGDVSSAFPYGQLEVVIGDSIADGTGTSSGNFASLSWYAILAANENLSINLPAPGLGFLPAGGGGGFYSTPQFSAIGASLALVAGVSPENSYPAQNGVVLQGTLNSLTATNSLTDNTVFNRALIFYKPQTNSDGIGVSYTGGGGSVTHTIDGTVVTTGGNSNVAFYDTGVVGSPTTFPTLSLTRATKVTGSGGVAPVILGVLYYAPGIPGNAGLNMIDIASGGTATADWTNNRTWESMLGAFGASIRRVHVRLGGNDIIRARQLTDAAFNNSTTLTSATAVFLPGDIGRPVTGNANIPAGTVITAVASTTSVTLSQATTGGNLSSQTVNLGQQTTATMQVNLALIFARIRAQCPLAEIAFFGEYQAMNTAASAPGYMPPTVFANTIAPLFQSIAVTNGCSFVDMYGRFGSVANYTLTDVTGMANASPIFQSTAQAQFGSADVGAIVTGTHIPANTTILSVQSATQVTLSQNCTGTASGTYTINHDVYGLTIDNGLHFGDYTNSAGKVDGQRAHAEEIIERLGYARSLFTTHTLPGWSQFARISPVYVSATQFTVTYPQNLTNLYAKGTKLRWTESNVIKYGVVASSSFSAGVTTVNLIATTDYAMGVTPDSGSMYYSYDASVPLFPSEFAFTPSGTGFTGGATAGAWSCNGNIMVVQLAVIAATGSTTAFTITNLPINPNFGSVQLMGATDSGTACLATASIGSASATVTLGKSVAGGAWTASGTRALGGTVTYTI